MPLRTGPIKLGHPYVRVSVSADQKTGQTYEALIDTGFSGFVSVPLMAATLLGLKAHATARYTLANGKLSEPVPLAYGFACLDGEKYLRGLISISESARTVIGMEFLAKGGKALILGSGGVVIMDEKELLEGLRLAGGVSDSDRAEE